MRLSPRRLSPLILLTAPLLLAGCMYYPLGSDSDYNGDGGFYGGASVGGGYYGAGPGYYPGGYPASGWYDDYYYPGNGYYVYDRAGRRHEMRDKDRARWLERREARRDDRREERVERRRERAERIANMTPEQRAVVDARRQERRIQREDRQDARRDTGVFNREARQAIRNAVRSRSVQTGDTPVRDN